MAGGSPARKHSPAPAPGKRPNTLGLRRRELDAIFDEIDLVYGAGDGVTRRMHVRRAFRHTTIPMQIFNRNGAVSATIAVACRNLSRSGIAAVHSSYVHIGTKVMLALPHPSGTYHVAVRGKVVRCQHFRGVVHDIGIRFENEINVRDMLALDPFGDWFSLEHVEAEQLRGSLLVVDGSAEDVRLLRQLLRETALGVSEAPSGAAALEAVGLKGFDVIVSDHALPDMSGEEFVTLLRERGAQTPVIITTAETSEELRLRVAACHADAFLAKPVDRETLFRAVAEFVVGRTEAEAPTTSAPVDPENPGQAPAANPRDSKPGRAAS